MLRFVWRRGLPEGVVTGSVVFCAFVLGGCSADVTRFNRSVLGLSEGRSTLSSRPIPQEGVYRMASAPPSMERPPPDAYAALPVSRTYGVRVAPLAELQPPLAAPAAPAVRSADYSFDAPAQPRSMAKGGTTGVQPHSTLYGLPKRRQVPTITFRPGQKLVLPGGAKAGNSTIKAPSSVRVAGAPQTVAPLADGSAQADGSYQVKPGTLPKMPAGSGGPLHPAAPAKSEQELATAALQPDQAAIVPNIINGAPKQVAALQAKETATDAVAASEGSGSAAKANGAEKASAPMPVAPPGKFRWPVKGKVIAGFGSKSDGTHNDGVNLAVPLGTEVHAAEAGIVAYAGSELKGYGQLILIRHDSGWVTAYAHNDQMLVKRDDKVRRGQVIAKAGKTGAVEQPQVHFEIRQGPTPVDPLPYLE
jgi:murein DD-endopeptidase MepM/ murein hydrolase activator NlpD